MPFCDLGEIDYNAVRENIAFHVRNTMNKQSQHTNAVQVFLFAILGLVATASSVYAESSSVLSVDHRALIQRADLTYAQAVADSNDGLPVGNGRMGTLVWTMPSSLKFQINRVDVYANNRDTQSFPLRHQDYCGGCAYVDIDFVDFGEDAFPAEQTRQHLAVYDGRVTVEGNGVTAQAVVWQEQDVMAVRIEDRRDKPVSIRASLRMLRPPVVQTFHHTAISRLEEQDGRLILTQEFREGDFCCRSAVALGIVGRDARIRWTDVSQARLAAEAGPGTMTFLIASAASFDPKANVVESALRQLETTTAKGYAGIVESNASWWDAFWSRSFVHLHSADGIADTIEAHYNYYLYLMASSSRGSLPPKFNGMIWLTKGDARPWGSQHWWHNLSCFYQALPVANHLELTDPMFDMYSGMYEACSLAARQQWGSKGVYLPETTWFDGLAAMPDDLAEEMRALYLFQKPWEERSAQFRGAARFQHPHSSRWNWIYNFKWEDGTREVFNRPQAPNGPYGSVLHIFSTTAKIAHQYWLRYEHSGDKQWLRERAYPMIKGSAEFYRNYPNVRKGDDGKYHIYRVNNHEPVWDGQDTLEEMSGMHGIIPVAIRASEILDVDADLRAAWRDFLDQLAPIPTAELPEKMLPPGSPTKRCWLAFTGTPVFGGGGEYPTGLLPIVFYDLCTLESDPVEISLGQVAFHRSYKPDKDRVLTSLDWLPIAAAKLGRDDAIELLLPAQLNLKNCTIGRRHGLMVGEGEPNYQHLGRVADALQLALCQSVPPSPGGEPVIRLFTAWPKKWDAAFTLLSRGGFLVSSSMRDGRVEFVEIRSQLGGPCRLRNPWGEAEVSVWSAGRKVSDYAGSLLTLATSRDETFMILPKGISLLDVQRIVPAR